MYCNNRPYEPEAEFENTKFNHNSMRFRLRSNRRVRVEFNLMRTSAQHQEELGYTFKTDDGSRLYLRNRIRNLDGDCLQPHWTSKRQFRTDTDRQPYKKRLQSAKFQLDIIMP